MRLTVFYSIFLMLAQSVASGTIEGTVVDSSGAVVVGAMVHLQNPITGFEQTAVTDSMGSFRFTNVPFNPYHLEITQAGFSPATQDVNVRSAVTVPVNVTMTVAGLSQTVQVEAAGGDILENVPYAHADVNITTLDKLPMLSPASAQATPSCCLHQALLRIPMASFIHSEITPRLHSPSTGSRSAISRARPSQLRFR